MANGQGEGGKCQGSGLSFTCLGPPCQTPVCRCFALIWGRGGLTEGAGGGGIHSGGSGVMWTFSKVLVLGVLADNMLFHILPPTASPTTDIFLSRLVSVIKKKMENRFLRKEGKKRKF